MRLMVLAGGFGTRLRQAVPDVPKPLAPAGQYPFLYFQIENWIAQGVRSLVFLLHHQADLIIQFLDQQKSGLLSECEVDCIQEPAPMGTGGAVAHAIEVLDLSGTLLVTNADTWLGTGMESLNAAGADAMAVVSQEDTARYGRVEIDAAGYVSAFREKQLSAGRGWINAGLYALNTVDLGDWRGQDFSLEREFFPYLLGRHSLKAVPLATDFIDIGVPEDYARFCRWQDGGRRGDLCN